jgi:hypothetical protein
MSRMLLIAATAAFALTACNDQSQQPANSAAIKVRGPEQNRLHELNALDLAIALKHAIYDAGYTCKRITDAGFVAEYQNLDMWMAHCTDGKESRDWAIFTGPDGSAQVRDCKDVPASGLPACKVAKRSTGSFNDVASASHNRVER